MAQHLLRRGRRAWIDFSTRTRRAILMHKRQPEFEFVGREDRLRILCVFILVTFVVSLITKDAKIGHKDHKGPDS